MQASEWCFSNELSFCNDYEHILSYLWLMQGCLVLLYGIDDGWSVVTAATSEWFVVQQRHRGATINHWGVGTIIQLLPSHHQSPQKKIKIVHEELRAYNWLLHTSQNSACWSYNVYLRAYNWLLHTSQNSACWSYNGYKINKCMVSVGTQNVHKRHNTNQMTPQI